MRIRQIRPEFFTDPVTARLSIPVRLIYIGLWCVADDAGWLRWDVASIGAVLFPYDSTRHRERLLEDAGTRLIEAHRMTIHDCRCAHIPTLERHQKIGGNKSFLARDEHRTHFSPDQSIPVRTSPPVTVGNGRVGNVTERDGRPRAGLKSLPPFEEIVKGIR